MKKRWSILLLVGMLIFCLAAFAEENEPELLTDGDWTYRLSGTDAVITGYAGDPIAEIPASLGADEEHPDGYPVTVLAAGALTNVRSVTVARDVPLRQIENGALEDGAILRIDNVLPGAQPEVQGEAAIELKYHAGSEGADGCLSLSAWNGDGAGGLSDGFTLPETCYGLAVKGFEEGALAGADTVTIQNESGQVDLLYHPAADGQDACFSIRALNDKTAAIPAARYGIPVTRFEEGALSEGDTLRPEDGSMSLTYHAGTDGAASWLTLSGWNRTGEDAVIPGTWYEMPIREIGTGAFSGRTALKNVVIPETVHTIGANAFYGCGALEYVDLPDGLTAIGNSAFYGAGLKALVLPDSVRQIGDGAFRNNHLYGVLTEADERIALLQTGEEDEAVLLDGLCTFPAELSAIGSNAFRGNQNLSRVTMPSDQVQLGSQAFDSSVEIYTALPECEWIYTIQGSECTIIGYLGSEPSLVVPQDLNGLHVTAFGDRVFKDMAFLRTVTLPPDTRSVGVSLFYNCRNLQRASLGETLSVLPEQSFFACTSLTGVTWPADTMREIGPYAFYNCVALTDAGIPEGVKKIDDGAFGGCGNMVTAVLPATLEEMGTGVFADCKSLTAIAIPDRVTAIDAGMQEGDEGSFSGCAALTSVTIGKGLRSLSSSTFAGLVNLQTVTIQADHLDIAYGAFSGCVALQEVTIRDAAVGDNAFNGCSGMKRFTLESGSLGYNPFSGCSALTTIRLGSGVNSLPYSAFSGLTRLSSVTLEGALTDIPDYAFQGCTSLTGMTLPASVQSIGYCAFEGSGLTAVTLPRDLNTIGAYAFQNCAGLAGLTWNSGLTTIGDYAFAGSAFTELTLPESVTEIGGSVFAGCEKLARIHLPANISAIGSSAFPAAARVYCSPSSLTARTLSKAGGSFVVEGEEMELGIRLLMRGNISLGLSIEKIWTDRVEIEIPSTIDGELVTEMGSGLFASCPSVQKVTFPTSVPAIPAGLCEGNESLKEVIIPEGVTIIGGQAFRNCASLHGVTLPDTVVSIGAGAFDGCALLTEITLSDNIQEIGSNAFTNTRVYCNLGSKTAEMLSQTGGGFICREYPLLRLRYLFEDGLPTDLEVVGAVAEAVRVEVPESVTSIAACAFQNNTTLNTVVLPETLTRVGESAFAGSGITALTLPAGITEIPARAFENTAALRTVTIQGAVTAVGEYAFSGSGVTGLTFRTGLETVGAYAFAGSGLESCVLPDTVTSLGSHAFDGSARLSHFDIPAAVTRIGAYTFYNTTELKTVSVPEGVETIAEYAFRNSGLASVALPETVKTIGYDAFYNCQSLKKVTMAGDMIRIGSNAFSNCILLNELTMSGTLETMDDQAFYNCRALRDVTLPRNLVSVPNSAFSSCSSLTHVKISDGTVNIGSSAFSGCNNLVSVELPTSLKGIANYAFESCAIKSLTVPAGVTTIGSDAFSSNQLTSLILPDCLASLSAGAFRYNSTLESLRLPANLYTVPDNAFYGSGLTMLSIPDGVRALGYQCFAQSSELRSVLIPRSVESIDDTAFDYCGYPMTVYCYHDTEGEAFALRKDYAIIYLDGENLLEGITVTPGVTELNIGVGDTLDHIRSYFTIQPEDIPFEYSLRFSVDQEDAIQVDETRDETKEFDQIDASITCLKPGTVLLKAALEDNPDICATITVHAREKIRSITLPEEIWQKKDEPLTLLPLATDPAGVTEGFVWSINRDVGYLEANVLHPTAYGSATLTVRAWNGVEASVALHVYDDPTEIRVRNVPVGLDTGMEAALSPQVRAGYLWTGREAQHFITWSSSDESIAAVDSEGKVTAVSYGTATISAAAENGVVGTADIYVTPPITSFELKGREMLPVGGSMVLTATEIQPANANPGAFTWTTSPAGLVSYENGVVTVLTDQECNVTITAKPWNDTDGSLAKTTALTIYRPSVESVTIDPVNAWNWVPSYSDIQLTAHVKATNEFINQLITWEVETGNGYSDYVDQNGVLHTSSSGWKRPVRVIATADNGVKDEIELYVVYPTTGFSLPDRITVQTGETITVDPVNDNYDYRQSGYEAYSMSVGTKALADVDGMTITGRAPGETALTVTSWNGVSVETRLLVYDPIEKVEITGLDSNQNKYAASDPAHDLFVQWDYLPHARAVSDKTYTDDLITWSSSDPSIIRVDNELTGSFRTVGYGTAVLTATAKSGARASTTLNVRKEVSTFTLVPIEGYVQADIPLKAASITDEDSYDGFVWSVDPADIGTVEGQVLHVDAKEPVTGTLTAVSWDGYVRKQTSLNIIKAPVTAVTLEEYGNGEVGIGGTYQMTAHVTAGIAYINRRVVWSSSDESIATVNEQGLVSCLAGGEVTITATADDGTGISDSITLTGVQGVIGFDILPAEITVFCGESADVRTDHIQPADAVVRDFTWTVSPEDVAVFENGKLTAVTGTGAEAVLTAESWNGITRSIPVHIIRPEISSLTMDPVGEVYVGKPVQLTARVTANGTTYENRFVRWESGDPEIAEVDENGVVTPKMTGSVQIFAYGRLNETVFDSVWLYPQTALEDYRIYSDSSFANLYYTKNNWIYIYATDFAPDGANTDVTYTVDAPEGTVSEVYQDGNNVCYFHYEGPETTLTVTGTSASGLTRTTTVDVRYDVKNLYYSAESGFDPDRIPVGGSIALPIRVDANGWNEACYANLKLTYASDNEAVAVINEHGVITGVSKGAANITVTHDYSGASVTIPIQTRQPVTSFDLPERIVLPFNWDVDLPVSNILPEDIGMDELKWTIDPEYIAKVENGKLTATTSTEAVGTLTVSSANGVTHTSTLIIALDDYQLSGNTYENLYYTRNNPIYIYAGSFVPGNTDTYVTFTAEAPEGKISRVEQNGSSGCYFYYDGPETTITVKGISTSGLERTTTVDVRYDIRGLRLDENAETDFERMVVGDTADLPVRVSADSWDEACYDNLKLSYASDNEGVVTVDERGTITAVGSGQAAITVTHRYSGRSLTVPVRVFIPMTSYELPEEILVPINGSIELSAASIQPETAEAGELEWTVSPADADVWVDKGTLYAQTEQEFEGELTAVSMNGITRTARLIVYYPVTALTTDGEYQDDNTFVPYTMNLYVGDETTLPIYVETDYGWDSEELENLHLTYESDNEEAATVDADGKVKARGKGLANIRVTHAYTGREVTIPVQVHQPITSYDLPGQIKIPTGGSVDLPVYNLLPAEADASELTWRISPEGIARVEDGKLIAISTEDTRGTLTAVSRKGVVRTANLIIYEPWVDEIRLEEVGTVLLGDEIQLIAHVTVGEEEFTNAGITFEGYWYVDESGNYYDDVRNYGTSYIELDEHTGAMRVRNLYTDQVYIVAKSELSDARDVIKIAIKPGYADFQVESPMVLTPGGASQRIRITGYEPLRTEYDYNPDYNNYLNYETDQNDLFTLGDYWVYPNGSGQTGVGTVRVRSANGVEREVQVVVYNENEIDGVTVTGVPELVGTYQNIQLTANLSMYGTEVATTGELVTWSSDNPKVASVNKNGMVRTLGYGTANITATTANGLTDTVAILVSREPENFTLPETFTVESGQSIELRAATVEPEDAVLSITWSVEPAEAASISGNVLTALAEENMTATITATNWDGTVRTTTLRITYTPPMQTMRLPAMLTEIEEEAFAGIAAQQVYIPTGCASIGARAFADSAALMVVHIPSSVTEIADSAFDGCGDITIMGSAGSAAASFAAAHGMDFVEE